MVRALQLALGRHAAKRQAGAPVRALVGQRMHGAWAIAPQHHGLLQYLHGQRRLRRHGF